MKKFNHGEMKNPTKRNNAVFVLFHNKETNKCIEQLVQGRLVNVCSIVFTLRGRFGR